MFSADINKVADAVKAASLGSATEDQLDVLGSLGLLLADRKLNAEGRAFEAAWCVYDDKESAEAVMQKGLLQLPETQTILQSLHGRGNVPVAGVVHYLASHKIAGPDDATPVRAFLTILRAAEIVAYSNKTQSVRVTTLMPDDGGPDPVVRVIDPDRPYSNVRHLRELLRGCRGHIWWTEPHFAPKLLESLADEADAESISEIRVLTGPEKREDLRKRGKDEFKRFQKEMQELGITAEWRIMGGKSDKHDRFLLDKSRSWNMPPINTLLKGDYSEIHETPKRPPFDEWWAEGTDLI
ncbi:MAG: hypothetical protein FVQ78_09780 [Solirubrobacterales bacterium]|nr:hypothetical protein [Solirubrobacterales bacterium]